MERSWGHSLRENAYMTAKAYHFFLMQHTFLRILTHFDSFLLIFTHFYTCVSGFVLGFHMCQLIFLVYTCVNDFFLSKDILVRLSFINKEEYSLKICARAFALSAKHDPDGSSSWALPYTLRQPISFAFRMLSLPRTLPGNDFAAELLRAASHGGAPTVDWCRECCAVSLRSQPGPLLPQPL